MSGRRYQSCALWQGNHTASHSPTSRRTFLKQSASATITAGALLSATALARAAYFVPGGDTLRIGLVGCGGRGTGAAAQALHADPNVKLVAMGDAFANRIKTSLDALQQEEAIREKLAVDADHQFVGFDAYKNVIEASDVVLLTTPPHFRPIHLKAAVDAGKHVFAEKPAAVDAPGFRSILQTCESAKMKGLCIVAGLCLRDAIGYQEQMKRLHDGAIGDIEVLQSNDYRGPIWVNPRQPGDTDMKYQLRNWYYYTWLCGDFNVEQHVHNLDICSWAMGGKYPVKAIGMGGRAVRDGENYGNIYDHFSVVYEYANGAKLFSNTRQMPHCQGDISNQIFGTKGRADATEGRWAISGENPWNYRGESNDIYQTEHDRLFAAIRKGEPINNGDYMAKSTLLAIMGRMAAYTGEAITWDQAMNSKESLEPKYYTWDAAPPPSPIARPGETKFL